MPSVGLLQEGMGGCQREATSEMAQLENRDKWYMRDQQRYESTEQMNIAKSWYMRDKRRDGSLE